MTAIPSSDVRRTEPSVQAVSAGVRHRSETVATSDAIHDATKAGLTQFSARRAIQIEVDRFLQHAAAGDGAVLVIPPAGPEGFNVELCWDGGRVRCLFGALEEEFDTAAAACEWVGRALSPSYRLRITLVSGRERAWRLEPVEPDSGDVLAMGHFALFDGFRRTSTIYKRNSHG